MRFLLCAAVCGVALALARTAGAETDSPAKVLADWGMLGTWAVNCAAPASRINGYSTYAAQGTSDAALVRDFGTDNPGDRSRIVSARIVGDGMIEITIDLTSINQVRANVFAKLGADRIRAMENRASDGSYTVRDGKFVHNGQPTLVQHRCR